MNYYDPTYQIPYQQERRSLCHVNLVYTWTDTETNEIVYIGKFCRCSDCLQNYVGSGKMLRPFLEQFGYVLNKQYKTAKNVVYCGDPDFKKRFKRDFIHCKSRKEAEALEAKMIKEIQPKLNIARK